LLAELFNSTNSSIDIVFMDSQFSLQGDVGDSYTRWAARRELAHIERIKTVINFYKVMTSKPIFLIGHSNGSLSIAEFLNQSSDHQQLISGVILSGSRNETELKQKISLPVLILHHKSDPNRWTTPSAAENLFLQVQQRSSSITELHWVVGGKDVTWGDPTYTGRHMYNEALGEAAKNIQQFLEKVNAN
jgi:alpha-beta hydrolase superfamily lysophospholipase